MRLPVGRVLAWRMRQQFLDRPGEATVAAIVRRLCGVQAQVAGSAEQVVAVRQPRPRRGEVDEALADRGLVKAWAMRGTLHLLAAEHATAFLSMIGAARTWEKGAWQRTFVTTRQLAAIADAAGEILHGRVLTREQLTAEIVARTGDASLAEHLGSGWGAVLKPLAWQGYLINGPNDGNRVTFTSPRTWLDGWTGLPEPEEAARLVIPAYLAAFGPASPEAFDRWLTRGASKRTGLKDWFAALASAGVLAQVEVDGEPGYARAADVDEIAATEPSSEVRLLPAFDQYVLGPGTASTQIIDAPRRGEISEAAGWISPVVLVGGRVAGTWNITDSALDVALFPEAGPVPDDAVEAEAARFGQFLGTAPRVRVRTAASA